MRLEPARLAVEGEALRVGAVIGDDLGHDLGLERDDAPVVGLVLVGRGRAAVGEPVRVEAEPVLAVDAEVPADLAVAVERAASMHEERAEGRELGGDVVPGRPDDLDLVGGVHHHAAARRDAERDGEERSRGDERDANHRHLGSGKFIGLSAR